jgi:hypothetical protein
LATKEKLLGPAHPDVGLTLNNLAVLCKSRQRYAEAEALYQRSLCVLERALGRKHPKVATCRQNYAALRREMSAKFPAPVDSGRWFPDM